MVAVDANLVIDDNALYRHPDLKELREALAGSRTRLLGPNSQGILAPEVCQVGVMATDRAKRGTIGVVSRSASLTSEITSQLTDVGLGQSTTVGIGGDPVHGLGFVDCLELFFADPQTEGIVLIGEIGGIEEQDAARYVREAGIRKPVVACIVGRYAPPERRMGHAGALTPHAPEDVESKIAALRDAGVMIAPSAHLAGETMREVFSKRAA